MSNHTPSADMMRRSVDAPCGALGDALEGREAPLSNHSRTADGAGSAVRISGHLSVRRQQRVSHDGRNVAPAVPQTGQNRDTAGGRSRYRLRDGGAVCSGPVL